VALAQSESVSEPARVYLNRLSDLLFVLCRTLNRAAGGSDVLWQPRRNESGGGPSSTA
jgi:cob(I)alamin adenosyltransferase